MAENSTSRSFLLIYGVLCVSLLFICFFLNSFAFFFHLDFILGNFLTGDPDLLHRKSRPDLGFPTS